MSAVRRSQYEKFLRSIGPSFSLGAITRVVADLQYGFEAWLRGPDTREVWKARILRHLLLASAPAISGGCVLTVEMEQRAVERAAYLQQHTAPPFPRSGVQADTVNTQQFLAISFPLTNQQVSASGNKRACPEAEAVTSFVERPVAPLSAPAQAPTHTVNTHIFSPSLASWYLVFL
jgi:hypothetical protein